MKRRVTIAVASLMCITALAACTANPAQVAAQKASQRPVTMQVEFFPMDEFSLWKKPASFTQDNTDEGNFPSKLGPVLINAGYAKMFYQIGCWRSDFSWNKGQKQCDNWYFRRLSLTDAGKALGWHCTPANDASKGTTCDVPVGTMQPGAAEIDDMMGTKYVKFYATPVANDLGKSLGSTDPIATNWSEDCGSIRLGTKVECGIELGPDGAPVH